MNVAAASDGINRVSRFVSHLPGMASSYWLDLAIVTVLDSVFLYAEHVHFGCVSTSENYYFFGRNLVEHRIVSVTGVICGEINWFP